MSELKSTARAGGRLYAAVHRMHTIAGIFVAPLLIVAAVTGVAYAAAPALEQVVYRHELVSADPHAPADAAAVADAVRAARQVHPELDVTAVQADTRAGRSIRVLFADGTLASKSYRRVVFVDPADGRVLGDSVQYGSANALPLRAWLSEGHRRLWLGEPGRIYSEAAASWLGALSISGLYVWAVRRRNRRKAGSAAPAQRGAARRRARTWHQTVALWALPGFLFLTVTGLTWSATAGGNIASVREQLHWLPPKPETTAVAAAEPGDQPAHGQDEAGQAGRVLAAARAEGLDHLLEAAAPQEAGEAWTVKEARTPWKLSNDAVAVDGASGRIVDRVDYASWPLAAKATNWLIQLHMGTLFGWVNQLVLGLLGIALTGVVVAAYLMWYLRGRGRSFGALPPRRPGGWVAMTRAQLIGWLVLLAGYAVIAPYFGVSLLAFFVLDRVLGRVRSTAA